MKKRATLYWIILGVWLLCLAILAAGTVQICMRVRGMGAAKDAVAIILLTANAVILGVLWLGSLKDLVFSVAFASMQRRMRRRYREKIRPRALPADAPHFVLLYCTCNDFNAKALSICLKQRYPNFKAVILDDSTKEEYRREIDAFAERRGLEVVRRADRKGFKAGNLNHYLMGRTDYDYFVVLDSDEVIPPSFLRRAYAYFAADRKFGAVQARHVATAGKNVFQRLLGMSVRSNGQTTQVIKNFYGANALLGHGMAVSRACYEATHGFPLVVAEDISFAVDIKNAGYEIVYAPDIRCVEEFPVDYVALKKRQCKWVQGNLEYMRKYGGDINASRMRWFEKMDIKLSHYSLPVVPVLGLLLVVFTVALGFLGYPIVRYSLFVYAMMFLFLCSPLIPDLFVYGASRSALLLLPAFVVNIATYASLAPMMLRTVALGAFGKKATFSVTPKTSTKFTFGQIVRYSWGSVLFALAVGFFAWWACGNVLPVVLICGGCLATPVILLLSNFELRPRKKRAAKAAA